MSVRFHGGQGRMVSGPQVCMSAALPAPTHAVVPAAQWGEREVKVSKIE